MSLKSTPPLFLKVIKLFKIHCLMLETLFTDKMKTFWSLKIVSTPFKVERYVQSTVRQKTLRNLIDQLRI